MKPRCLLPVIGMVMLFLAACAPESRAPAGEMQETPRPSPLPNTTPERVEAPLPTSSEATRPVKGAPLPSPTPPSTATRPPTPTPRPTWPRTPAGAAPFLPPFPVPAAHVSEQFQAGRVVALQPGQLVLQTPDQGVVTLYLLPETEIWEGRWVKDIPIQVGDEVVAWGHRRPDGSLKVTRLWVNIVNLMGPIADVRKEGDTLRLRLQDLRWGWQEVVIAPQTFIVVPGLPRVTFAEHPVDLEAGQVLQIIGRQLQGGPVLATEVWVD